jgi:glucose-6-phosphate dehydrogenase assembly protein OpcA
VDVSAIREEMTKLWKEAAGPTKDEAAPVTRACLVNLVVWSWGDASAGDLADTIARVVQVHPARVLLMEIEPGAPADRLEAWISAHCTIPRAGARQVCCEQVTLKASADASRHLPGLLGALRSSNLPVCLYLAGEPTLADQAFRRLAVVADQLLVDTGSLAKEELEQLLDLAGSLKRTRLGDLNWRRLRPFQDQIAAFFDPSTFRPRIPHVSAVETAGGPGTEASARLLAGWVRAVLEGREISFKHAEEASTPSGVLRLARLQAGGRTPTEFIVESDPSSGTMIARVEMEGTCPVPRRTRHEVPEPWQLITGQLERSSRDPLFETSLAHAARFD